MYGPQSYDRWVDRYDDSPINSVKQKFYTAKQMVNSKFGKKEDPHLLASDAELDAKLEVFHAVRRTCDQMLRCIENYQDYICDLSQEENALGRFLKERGKTDKTQAGKMMCAVGRAQGYSAQQRLALRVPLVRLYQELDVFYERAVQDCLLTVEAMEKARADYRGSLLWMKTVSEELDPDAYKRLEKFRTVQAQVKRNKARFDKLKLDCLQKIDLLAASRCNLFSQILASYQNCLLRFWDKTAKAHGTVSETFKGYQHYEFTIVKDLIEPSRKLAELTSGEQEECEGGRERKSQENVPEKPSEELISLGETGRTESLENLFRDSPEHKPKLPAVASQQSEINKELEEQLLSSLKMPRKHTAGEAEEKRRAEENLTLLKNVDQADRGWLEELFQESSAAPVKQTAIPDSQGEFAEEWDRVFGPEMTSTPSPAVPQAAQDALLQLSPQKSTSGRGGLLPSQLLDWGPPTAVTGGNKGDLMNFAAAPAAAGGSMAAGKKSNKPSAAAAQKEKDKLNAWFNLFADIDPLQNPDQIGAGASSQNRNDV